MLNSNSAFCAREGKETDARDTMPQTVKKYLTNILGQYARLPGALFTRNTTKSVAR